MISAVCVRVSVERGHEVTVLNRGKSAVRQPPDGVEVLRADLRDGDAVGAVLGDRRFDVVAQFMAFSPDHVDADIARFTGRTRQYVFVSSASAYQKPPASVPVTESTPLKNPFWRYSREKIACEDRLVGAYREADFPMTVVRPSHTYDDTKLPTLGKWTDIARMRAGRPVVVHGDGTTQWTLTHSDDFAVGFVGLLGRPEAIGNAYTITGDSAPTWNQVYQWLARAAGVEQPRLVHVASEAIAAAVPELGPGLVGDKAYSMVFERPSCEPSCRSSARPSRTPSAPSGRSRGTTRTRTPNRWTRTSTRDSTSYSPTPDHPHGSFQPPPRTVPRGAATARL